mmetsp:Transcript_45873/g.76451  ORF Transcript_45873/g.76451 Transcript_45873/m.76451 type:complete len:85 (+) Transcript_45873:1778-2032(+)
MRAQVKSSASSPVSGTRTGGFPGATFSLPVRAPPVRRATAPIQFVQLLLTSGKPKESGRVCETKCVQIGVNLFDHQEWGRTMTG